MILLKFLFVSLLVFQTSIVMSQELPENVKLRKVEYLSRKMNISIEDARQYLIVLEASTKAANKIYMDSSLTDSIKKVRLKIVFDERDLKIKRFIPDQNNLNKINLRQN